MTASAGAGTTSATGSTAGAGLVAPSGAGAGASITARGPTARGATLESRHPKRQRGDPGVLTVGSRWTQRAEQAHLDEEAGVDRLTQVHLRFRDQFEEAQPEPGGRDGREIGHESDLVRTNRRTLGVPKRDKLGGTREARDVTKQLPGIGAGIERGGRRPKRARGIGAGERRDQGVQGRRIREPERAPGDGHRDRSLPGAERLLEQHQRVAQAALGRGCQQQQRAGVDLLALLLGDLGEQLLDRRNGDAPEVEALHARSNRLGHLVRLGRREHEEHVRGRLLEGLEKGVPGLRWSACAPRR